jgi:glycosyl transferase family 25
MKNQLPIFVISLKYSTERRNNVSKHFNKIGVSFEWFDAVVGKELTEKQIEELCDREALIKYATWLTKGQIGCSLSHYYLYLEIIKRNLPYALIMEDDAILNADFLTSLDIVIDALRTNEVIMLYYTGHTPLHIIAKSKEPINNTYSLYTPLEVGRFGSTAGYLITNAACKTLSEIILPVRTGADGWELFNNEKGFEYFRCIYPHPVDTYNAKSTIGYINNKNIARITGWIDQYKIFPFYQLLNAKRNRLKEKMKKVEFV